MILELLGYVYVLVKFDRFLNCYSKKDGTGTNLRSMRYFCY